MVTSPGAVDDARVRPLVIAMWLSLLPADPTRLADRLPWFVLCSRDNGRVLLGSARPLPPRHRRMAGPFDRERAARAWTDRHCPSWRCTPDGECR